MKAKKELMQYAMLLTGNKKDATTLFQSTMKLVDKNIAANKVGDVARINPKGYMCTVMNIVYLQHLL